jgi:hypothetical protein
MTPFGIAAPGRILFGRGEAAKAVGLIVEYGQRGVVVHGAQAARAAWLIDGLRGAGANVLALSCAGEPTLAILEAALTAARGHGAQWVVGLGGGAALDLGKAVAGLAPGTTSPMDHLEVVGRGLPLSARPLPFIAIPTTSGTGAEATKNAVIGIPEHGRKVSLRDDRMLARLAIVDPALTDGSPRAVTLASGLDAITQVIEPYVCTRANAFTDALTLPAIQLGINALIRLMQGEEARARDEMAWVSLCGGLALANAGLGAVHGLAGVIGGRVPSPHGAICGVLLGPVLAVNRDRATGVAQARLDQVCGIVAAALGVTPQTAPAGLARWATAAGLPTLAALGLDPADHAVVAAAALASSSMKGNPAVLSAAELIEVLNLASRRA